ncbi:hypothetical protein Misp03_36400 [Microbispora sp. NBRC 16548]|nr:hypothetical protein Misp03_36400 [Microbispora sp. NBRC 16548]
MTDLHTEKPATPMGNGEVLLPGRVPATILRVRENGQLLKVRDPKGKIWHVVRDQEGAWTYL